MVAGKVISIQYLRAFAATLVVFHHAFSIPGVGKAAPFPFGQAGVELFFVISGAVMWLTTDTDEKSPWDFWKARVLRVVPLYWLYTSLFAVSAAKALTTTPLAWNFAYVVKSYFFVPAVNPVNGELQPLYSLGWTLNYEMFFYLLFGLTLFVPSASRRLGIILATLILLCAAGYVFPSASPIQETWTAPIILDFAAGIALARAAAFLSRLGPGAGAALMIAAVVLAGSSVPFALGLAAAAMVAGAMAMEALIRRAPSRFLLFLGNASYSIYLAHPFAQRAFAFFAPAERSSGTSMLALGTVVGVAGGAAAFLLIERPLARQLKRLKGAMETSGGVAKQPSIQ